MTRRCLCLLLVLLFTSPIFAQRDLGFDNRKPSGQDYLKPEESLARMKVPAGFEVKLVAAEPDVINPIAFTIDERGRLWVVECFEYPKRTPKGQKPRDRIKILEDTDGDGKVDKVTIWAEGKDLPLGWDLATGIEVGNGGVYLGAAPHLFFLQDTKGAGKCDKQEVLLSGFGSQDTHETLNTFQWGPDGLLYGLHGIFTQSKVGEVKLNAAVWRYRHLVAKSTGDFDIFAEGTSNPWGLDFDPHGQAFLTACVIPHAFHMIPGGTYIRQAGGSFNPYAYGLLKEISDHRHHAESGWAHAGALILQGDHIPEEYRGHLLMGSIHGCVVKRDVLERQGSTFIAKHAPDFLVSGDKNFRPINLRWGPDGAIYVIDWHDQNPCHQAHPDSWDQKHGRIYKIQRTGAKQVASGDLSKKSSAELVELLKNNSAWWHRTALRLLKERGDRSVAPQLLELVLQDKGAQHSLRGLWGLYVLGAFDDAVAEKTLGHKSFWVRAWTIRLLGESGKISEKMLARFAAMAVKDESPEVRLQLASTCQRLRSTDMLTILHNLIRRQNDARDACLPLMIWLAYEPQTVTHRDAVLGWLKENAAGNLLATDEIVPRVMRRLVATDKPEDLAACVGFLSRVTESTVRRRALEGLLLALQQRQLDAPAEWKQAFAELTKDRDAEVQRLSRRLAVNFRDPEAIRRSLAIARDTSRPAGERAEAVRDLALAHPAEALTPLVELVARDADTAVRSEACRALSAYDGPEVPKLLLAGWKSYPPALRVEAVNLLTGRKEWARALLTAVGDKRVPATDLTNNYILRIHAFRDKELNSQIEKVWGRLRDTPAELNALIDKMRLALHDGRGSFERGRKIFENQCAKCHKFEGKGANVGPDLDGAARDIEYLLANIIDPNRVIGQPYFVRVAELKNGKVETGLLAEEDEQSITLKTENDKLTKILKKDIEGPVRIQEKSVMPEGLGNNMTVQDLRDLIRYVMVHPFLTDVSIAGPYGVKETPTIDFNNPTATKAMSWQQPMVGVPGRIALPAAKAAAITFVVGRVTAPSPMKTRLQLGAAHQVRVWVNGKEAYNAKPGATANPDQAGADVELREGVNHILLLVTYQGDREVVYARLLDPNRRLVYPEVK